MATNILGVPTSNVIVPYSSGSTMRASAIMATSENVSSWPTITSDGTTLYVKDGWAWANGASLSQTTFAELYARISTTWNTAVDPLTGSAQSAPTAGYFRIPNLKGTFLRGVGDFTDNTKDTTLAGFQTSQNLSHNHFAGFQSNPTGSTGNKTGWGYTEVALDKSSIGASVDISGSTESRPQNVGVYYLVKLYDNAAPVDVYIPPASAGIAGLVNNVVGNTSGTPILGKTDGVAVAIGNIGEIVYSSTPENVSTSSVSEMALTASKTLNKGSYLAILDCTMLQLNLTTAGTPPYAESYFRLKIGGSIVRDRNHLISNVTGSNGVRFAPSIFHPFDITVNGTVVTGSVSLGLGGSSTGSMNGDTIRLQILRIA